MPEDATRSDDDKRNSGKREDYLAWNEYFMLVARAASMRSKDPQTQVGCVIVNEDKVIVGTGYNGLPAGCDDDKFPWGKGNENPLENKYAYVVHAEQNAIMNKIGGSIRGCTLYTTLFPCNECAKLIVQSKIAKIVYQNDKEDWRSAAARKMFQVQNPPILSERYEPSGREIRISL
ncbi:unnamed protein product [Caenorhabditis auriculariae]|uniref:Probable deoxycytidylate deaminase n=1 Tax=Caenorhabditis auriculariae TaxID=2777116 RepID=A0A8S1GU36_9PELO|nr:unnamed protein product [Caenorhabditis auriculariae]